MGVAVQVTTLTNMREDEEVEVVIGAYTIGGLEKGGGRKN